MVSYKRRTGELVIKVGRTRHTFDAKRSVPITVDGKRGRHEWLTQDVPVRVTPAGTPDAPRNRRGRSRRSRRTANQSVVESIEILTVRITGRILSLDRSGRFRVTRESAPASRPATTRPTEAPSRARRRRQPRRTASLYLTTARRVRVTDQGKRSRFSRLKKGQRVDVTYIPTGRYPMAVAINVVGDPDAPGRPAVRIRIGPDGNAETIRPEDVREQDQRSDHDDPGSQDRNR